MSKIYQIETVNGTVRKGWGEIICAFIEVTEAGVIKFFEDDTDDFDDPAFARLILCYKLAEGEALLYVGENK